MSGNWAWSPQGFVKKAQGAVNSPAGQPAAVPPASAGSGRNRPLPKRPQKGGIQPGSDEELNQFRQWQGSQSQWSGLGTGRVWRGYEALGGIGIDHDRSQYKFHDVHPRTGWGSGRAVRSENVDEGQGEDTRPATVEGGVVDMTPTEDDWSAKEETFTPTQPKRAAGMNPKKSGTFFEPEEAPANAPANSPATAHNNVGIGLFERTPEGPA